MSRVSQATRPFRVLLEDGVEDGVGDLVGHLVGVALGDRLGGELEAAQPEAPRSRSDRHRGTGCSCRFLDARDPARVVADSAARPDESASAASRTAWATARLDWSGISVRAPAVEDRHGVGLVREPDPVRRHVVRHHEVDVLGFELGGRPLSRASVSAANPTSTCPGCRRRPSSARMSSVGTRRISGIPSALWSFVVAVTAGGSRRPRRP